MLAYFLEIKNRLFLTCVTWFSTFLICYFYKEILLFLVVQPNILIHFFYFIFTDVTEIFTVYITLIFFLSFQVLIFYLLYHSFIFISPALFYVEYTYFFFVFKFISFIWLISIFLASYIVIPMTWKFFLSFQYLSITYSFDFHFEAKLNEYVNFYISLYYL